MNWTPEREAELVKMRAEGRSYTYMAAALFGDRRKKGAIAGKLARIDNRIGPPRHRPKKRVSIADRTRFSGDWDAKLFEPWAEYTHRKKLERANAPR